MGAGGEYCFCLIPNPGLFLILFFSLFFSVTIFRACLAFVVVFSVLL